MRLKFQQTTIQKESGGNITLGAAVAFHQRSEEEVGRNLGGNYVLGPYKSHPLSHSGAVHSFF